MSDSKNDKIVGHNYILGVTIKILDGAEEQFLVKMIEDNIIQKIHSRDLGFDVDFFKNSSIGEPFMLERFQTLIENLIKPLSILSLSLERDSNTIFTLSKTGTS